MGKPNKQLGTLRSGEKVFDRPKSHVRIHKDKHLEEHLPIALKQTDSNDLGLFWKSVDFVKTIGMTNCVETTDNDEIIFAIRKGRKNLSRFIMHSKMKPTSIVTTVLKKIPEGYILITAYFGPKAPPEPWDPHAESDSIPFWSKHALVWNKDEIIHGTETKDGSAYFL